MVRLHDPEFNMIRQRLPLIFQLHQPQLNKADAVVAAPSTQGGWSPCHCQIILAAPSYDFKNPEKWSSLEGKTTDTPEPSPSIPNYLL
jgi:hypothetical protein